METLKKPIGSCLFAVVSYSDEATYREAKLNLEKSLSKIMFESNFMPKWIHNTLEEKLQRKTGLYCQILAFFQRIQRDSFPEIKKITVELDKLLQKKDNTLSIYPGYLTSHNVILASATDDLHKIYLFNGVYAEIIFRLESGAWKVEKTAPEFFKTKEALFFFASLHENYEFNKDKA